MDKLISNKKASIITRIFDFCTKRFSVFNDSTEDCILEISNITAPKSLRYINKSLDVMKKFISMPAEIFGLFLITPLGWVIDRLKTNRDNKISKIVFNALLVILEIPNILLIVIGAALTSISTILYNSLSYIEAYVVNFFIGGMKGTTKETAPFRKICNFMKKIYSDSISILKYRLSYMYIARKNRNREYSSSNHNEIEMDDMVIIDTDYSFIMHHLFNIYDKEVNVCDLSFSSTRDLLEGKDDKTLNERSY